MIYEKDKIRRLIEYKDEINNDRIRLDFEWIIERYNDYYVASKDFEFHKNNYNKIVHMYYNAEEEKDNLKNRFIMLKNKYLRLKDLYKGSCDNKKNMI